MEDRLSTTAHQVKTTSGRGRYLAEPSHHFTRIFLLFSQADRKKLLEAAYRYYLRIIRHHCTIWQFCAYELLHMEDVHGYKPAFNNDDEMIFLPEAHYDEWGESPNRAKPEHLTQGQSQRVDAVMNGLSALDLARLVAGSAISPDFAQQEDFDELLKDSFGSAIITADQAAAIAGCIDYNRKQIDGFQREAISLVADVKILPAQVFPHRFDRDGLTSDAKGLRDIASLLREEGAHILKGQENLARIDSLVRSFIINDQIASLPVSDKMRQRVRSAFAMLCSDAERSRDALLQLSPRAFEEFMANLFTHLGFEVELTQTTRDGGADLLCLCNKYDIPFRLAVELKRYHEKPISVSLVRSFVGSNEQFRANRLLYVTTSKYTQYAMAYADSYASHILTLRNYDAIQEWCRAARSVDSRQFII